MISTHYKMAEATKKRSKIDEGKLNNPWFSYPGMPCAGYVNADVKDSYLRELFRLQTEIKTLSSTIIKDKKAILFHLTIGSPMEEAGVEEIEKKNCQFQMHQLIPHHLLMAGKNGIEVINFVVCPNEVSKPMFYEKTSDFIKEKQTIYKHKNLPIKILFFTTLIPTDDTVRNKKIIKLLDEKFTDMDVYKQTLEDVKFVGKFYFDLETSLSTVKSLGGACTCFSFAVFNDDTLNRQYNNFSMFKEILNVYHKNNSVIAEWVFRYKTYTLNNFSFDNGSISSRLLPICYVPYMKLAEFSLECSFIIPMISNSRIMLEIISAEKIVKSSHLDLDEDTLMIPISQSYRAFEKKSFSKVCVCRCREISNYTTSLTLKELIKTHQIYDTCHWTTDYSESDVPITLPKSRSIALGPFDDQCDGLGVYSGIDSSKEINRHVKCCNMCCEKNNKTLYK